MSYTNFLPPNTTIVLALKTTPENDNFLSTMKAEIVMSFSFLVLVCVSSAAIVNNYEIAPTGPPHSLFATVSDRVYSQDQIGQSRYHDILSTFRPRLLASSGLYPWQAFYCRTHGSPLYSRIFGTSRLMGAITNPFSLKRS
jgi:hypothetical protein